MEAEEIWTTTDELNADLCTYLARYAHLRILLILETCSSRRGSSLAAGIIDCVPNGLKLTSKCSDLAGDDPRTCS